MRVSVPASTANLGAGFDCLALALEERFHLDVGEPHGPHSVPVPAGHPAAVAFAQAQGSGDIFFTSTIAPGKGMGYSGAARVAGLAAGWLSRCGWVDHPEVCRLASDLEGHADNAAASVYGGLVVAAAGRVIRMKPPLGVRVVMWVPDGATSTAKARSTLPDQVSLADAVENIGRASLMVAALATGDLAAIRDACQDQLHQQLRLANRPESTTALEAATNHELALGAWLSGSGPSVAALATAEHAPTVADALPGSGHTKVLPIATFGIRVGAGAELD